MKVIYTAPNRAHHYIYAKALYEAGILKMFVSGFSRYSPRAKLPELGKKLFRADLLQTLYLVTLKLGLSEKLTGTLAYYSKIEQDKACKPFLNDANIFLFYNGSGLSSCRYANRLGIITIVEAVNSHVDYQEKLLKEEHERLNIPFTPFNKKEKARRLKEYEEADYIMLPSEFVKRSFLQYGFPEEKLLKVPYGYNTYDGKLDFATTKETFTVLYVGTISVRKGVRYLINAFKKLNHPNKKLMIVGPHVEPSGIKDILLTPDIDFTGPLKGEALQAAYKSADVFCLPSIEEGFALVLGEALSYGIPLVATSNTGAYDLMTDCKEGFIVPVGDEESIYTKLQLLADDPTLLQEMKACATATAKNLNGWTKCKEKLVSTLYQCKKPNPHEQ